MIADLSINFVDRQALLTGFTFDRLVRDYGLDLILFTYDDDGFVEPGQVLFQVKATDSPSYPADGRKLAIRIERAHLLRWLAEVLPVILVVYDAPNDVAYWTHIQGDREHLESLLRRAGATLTIHISTHNRIDGAGMRDIARIRNETQARASRKEREHG